jgi:hypothetical protein
MKMSSSSPPPPAHPFVALARALPSGGLWRMSLKSRGFFTVVLERFGRR